ncbi:MAG TPA: FecR domain-containing protein [Saprospiraceae bacterium]|nr:FecR domain-containing protein [Saprospiraceae bacterium]
MEKIWELSGKYDKKFQPDVEKGLSRLKQRIESERKSARVVKFPFRKGWKIAAGFFVLIAAAFIMRTYFSQPETVVVTTGEARQEILLSDGSIVWLNKNSQLEYPENFEDKTRQVSLKGEGFLKVAKDAVHPFIVKTKNLEVTVLGTEFNVRDMEAENFSEVQVREGKVAMKAGAQSIVLTANDKGVFNKKDKKLDLSKNTALNSGAWQTGELKFKNIPLGQVIEEVERFYNITVKVKNPKLALCGFSGNFGQENLAEVFEILESVFDCKIARKKNGAYEVTGGIACD